MHEKPMVHRCAVILLASLPLAVSAAAQDVDAPSLDEAQAVSLALAHVPLEALADADADLSRAVGLVDGAWTNPELGYTREEAFGTGGTGEDYAYLSARFDVSGRLFLRRDAGERRASAAATAGEAARAELAAVVRERFYRALTARDRARVLEAWCQRVRAALEVVARRAEAGDAAPYDALRLRREERLAAARRDEARAEAAGLEAGLAALVGIEGPITLTGEVLPALGPSAAEGLVHAAEEAPALRSLRELEDAASIDAEASRRGWVPELLLGAGYKGVTSYAGESYRNDGFTLTVGITLPFFDTGSARTMRDDARARTAGATLEIETERTHAAAAEAATRLLALLELAGRLSSDGVAEREALLTGASRAYEGGELGVLELLDAHRSATEDALFSVDLALEARRSLIELLRLAGRTD